MSCIPKYLNAILHYKKGTSVSRELSDENQNGRHFVTSLQFESAHLNIAITNSFLITKTPQFVKKIQ